MKKAALIIHGFLGSPEDFGNLHQMLEDKYDYVESLILPGHGIGNDYDYDKFKAQVTMDYVLKEYDRVKKDYDLIDVIGHSMGGSLAAYLANKRKVNKLVLLAPALKYINVGFGFERMSFLLKNAISLRKAKKDNNMLETQKYEEEFKILKYDDMESLKFMKEKYLKTYFPKAALEFTIITKKILNEVKVIDCPLLVVWGKLDQLVPKDSIEFAHNICTNEVNKVIIHDDISHLMLNTLVGPKIIDEIIEFLIQ